MSIDKSIKKNIIKSSFNQFHIVNKFRGTVKIYDSGLVRNWRLSFYRGGGAYALAVAHFITSKKSTFSILWYATFDLVLSERHFVKNPHIRSYKLTPPLLQFPFANIWHSSWLGRFFDKLNRISLSDRYGYRFGGLNLLEISINTSFLDRQKHSSCHAQSEDAL